MTAQRGSASPVALGTVVGGSPFAGLDVCCAAMLPVEPPLRSRRPRFEQDVWDFTCVVGLPRHQGASEQTLDFARVPGPRWRRVAKEYVVALLAPEHPAVRELPRAYRTPR